MSLYIIHIITLKSAAWFFASAEFIGSVMKVNCMDPKNGNRLFSDKKLMQNVHQGGRSNRVCYQDPFAKNESPRSKLRGILDDSVK